MDRDALHKYMDELRNATRCSHISVPYREEGGLVEFAGLDLIVERLRSHNDIAIVGNGGSAAIASHAAVDLVKRGKRATAFNDPATLTMLANDYGYQDVYARQIRTSYRNLELLIAISSSGKSENILRAVEAAKSIGAYVITFSGFYSGTPLRLKGDINVWTPSQSYGYVELAHQTLLHAAIEQLPEIDTIKKIDMAGTEGRMRPGGYQDGVRQHHDRRDALGDVFPVVK